MNNTKLILAGDLEVGMSLVEQDGALLEVKAIRKFQSAPLVSVDWATLMFSGTSRFASSRRLRVFEAVTE